MLKDKIKKIITPISLILIFCLAFFIRTYFSYKIIFSDGVVKYTDDAMYHMRFLENMLLGGHFPYYANFDAFTIFPHGTYNNIAPLYDFLIGSIIWIVSFGKPTQQIIDNIAPFYPVVLGSLIPIVVYFIAKALWNDKRISLISALLSAVIHNILFKSLLAYSDHHVAEVLFSSLSIMFLLFALSRIKDAVLNKNKIFWFYVIMSGFSMGIYLLNWTGAILFLSIIAFFLSVYYVIEFISNRQANHILITGATIFLIPFLMIAPFFGHPDLNFGTYNINHLILFSFGLLSFLAFWLSSLLIKKKSLNRWLILIFPIIIMVCLIAILALFSPYVLGKMLTLANGVNNNGLSSINFKRFIGEMRPLGVQGAISTFFSLFFIFLLGFFIICYRFLKNRKPEELFLIIWSVANFLIAGIIPFFGQQRFDIYLDVNVCLLSAFVIVKGLEFGWSALDISSHLDKNIYFRAHFITGSLAILIGLAFLVLYPIPFNAGAPTPMPDVISIPLQTAKDPIVLSNDWYNVFKWLREKTPDPGLDYYALYNEPGLNTQTGKSNDYAYPQQAYGVLAPWDKGHAIEYYSHRMPVANNFQQGVGRKENGKVTELGEGVFFLETDENKAISYLDQLKVKYVVTDSRFAILDVGYFEGLVKWVQGNTDGYIDEPENSPTKYDNSMVARLHILDGSSAVIEKKSDDKTIDLNIESLKHFRLLYESDTTVRLFPIKDLTKNIKMVKIFEPVKGAKIKGWATPLQEVDISTEITTNQARKFVYENGAVAKEDGSFEFIVPYSTGKQENSDVSATDYTIKIGNYTKKIKVSEEDVLQGKTIKIY